MVCVCVLVTQACLTLCDAMDCRPRGSYVHGILQARKLEWVAMPFSRGLSPQRGRTWVSCTAGRFFTVWAAENKAYDLCTLAQFKDFKKIPRSLLPANFFLPSFLSVESSQLLKVWFKHDPLHEKVLFANSLTGTVLSRSGHQLTEVSITALATEVCVWLVSADLGGSSWPPQRKCRGFLLFVPSKGTHTLNTQIESSDSSLPFSLFWQNLGEDTGTVPSAYEMLRPYGVGPHRVSHLAF